MLGFMFGFDNNNIVNFISYFCTYNYEPHYYLDSSQFSWVDMKKMVRGFVLGKKLRRDLSVLHLKSVKILAFLV